MAVLQDKEVSMAGECSQVYREDGYYRGKSGRRTGGFGLLLKDSAKWQWEGQKEAERTT